MLVGMSRAHLLTELRNPDSMTLDSMSIEQAVAVMNKHDAIAQQAVAAIAGDVAKAVEVTAARLLKGGKLVYFGAGTSGRLGVLDASECPPTFRSDPSMVQGVIAGGKEAMFVAQEGAEDSAEGGARDVDARQIGANDVVCGIAAGGTTLYVHGALARARELGAATLFVTCVQPNPQDPPVDIILRPQTGPEVLSGSTRLKAGTATKLVLNQLTTLTMVRLGKCYENLMVDLKASNIKLRERATRMVMTLTDIDYEQAAALLVEAQDHVKTAVVMHKLKVDLQAARARLDSVGGQLRKAIG